VRAARVDLRTAGSPAVFPFGKNTGVDAGQIRLLSRDLGLPTVEVELREIGGGPHLLVGRYDRAVDEDGAVTRLHQEDLCQALGLRPTLKYEEEGGPSFARCFQVVADHSTEPALDTVSLLRWLAFNVVVGNADGHAKNLSLLRTAEGRLRLAPFYDLVCTAIYPGLDRELAMSVGSAADPGAILGRDWRALADQIGVRPGYLVDLVREMAEAAPGRADAAADGFRDRHGDSPALQRILPGLRRRARRTLRLLED
jgi:serine/threonine-protein kinase HipA